MTAKRAAKKKPYKKRSDEEKVADNWQKTLGLFERREYSVAVIRAATALEIASNLVIRHQLVKRAALPGKFVDTLLLWANGLNGKMQRLIDPIFRGTPHEVTVRRIAKDIRYVNKQRNCVAHSGEFRSRAAARTTIDRAHTAITELVRIAGSHVQLKRLQAKKKSASP